MPWNASFMAIESGRLAAVYRRGFFSTRGFSSHLRHQKRGRLRTRTSRHVVRAITTKGSQQTVVVIARTISITRWCFHSEVALLVRRIAFAECPRNGKPSVDEQSRVYSVFAVL
jgi:hypothetical protein